MKELLDDPQRGHDPRFESLEALLAAGEKRWQLARRETVAGEGAAAGTYGSCLGSGV